ncbi:NDP-sugar epimerase, includes UDP-GlcNAc-inverting 4,6-dehydratase FlaA1 and capsular polysaccharide biosynthesis protein EpsC [Eubacterium uniforme]|uniref:NDP-sugar epimerase, includes UDP-GlcNAc-inverting 4,6-dehydratase FlaA1 and capsular polysaccharide biosynthesis protein EpsC n=1 Tax=Eubacterium uniforme TaxID=39495 RepID=A0A1T4VDD7_9FIRM|nr:NDP-sugar epimerase, includes UDP-GlcNAc-inverting 4,6-dehydratase FlaA1 and capsular polysaccharide biosynthesis protein EpsC [Eubacterium uniforme]
MADLNKKDERGFVRALIDDFIIPQRVKVLLVIYDIVVVSLAYFFALLVRFDFSIGSIDRGYLVAWAIFLPYNAFISVVAIWYFRLYNCVMKYVGTIEMLRGMAAAGVVGLVHTFLITVFVKRMPITYYVLGTMFWYILVIWARLMFRFMETMGLRKIQSTTDAKHVMIIGGGDAGNMILRELVTSSHIKEKPVCIIDDDRDKWMKYVGDVQVVGGRDEILANVEKFGIKKIYIAMPSASKQDIRDIITICSETKCEIKTLPAMYKIADGSIEIKDMKDVGVEDLLGRDQVQVNMDEIYDMISGKNVLITGGGGSIGSEIALQVSRHNPKTLIILDIYENNAYAIQQKIKMENPNCNLVVLIGSVRDSRRLDDVFRKYRPDIVYHAAAHKHVPLMEDSPCEAIKNNVIGTYKTAYAAMTYGVKRFVLISTDKAVNPTNVMGASKRLCELVIQTFDKMIKQGRESEIPQLCTHYEAGNTKLYHLENEIKTEFVAVRFGNVLGSNGSVIPLFKEQIHKGGPVTVTHPDIIRYFMTIPEAASLVLQAGCYAKGGEIFILDMGEPVKIVDLARNLIKLSGFEPDVDIKIEYVGLRPGEKLYEEKLMDEEGLTRTPNKLIHIAKPIYISEDRFLSDLADLMVVAYQDTDAIRVMVSDMVDTFRPSNVIPGDLIKQYRTEVNCILGK